MTSNVENDPNALKICPYDPVHKVRAKRFPYHLEKCRKQYASAGWKQCPFFARHEIPVEELEYHLSICEYKDMIRQDIEEAGLQPIVEEKRLRQPQPTPAVLPEETEDWETEANRQPFSILTSEPQDESRDAYDVLQAIQDVQAEAHARPNLIETSGMTPAQKKNFKRAQKRQERREAESQEPKMTNEEKAQILAKEYSLLNNTGSFVDFVSILNQHCQKSKINVPKYGEAPGVDGGFGAQCFVKGQIFKCMKCCSTKKEARHDAAMRAVLGLNIPVVDPTPNKRMDARTATDHQKLRETHELQLLKEAQQAPAKGRGRPTVQQPVSSFSTSATGPPMSQQPSQYMAVNNFTEVTGARGGTEDDEWTTVGKKGLKNPVYQHSLKMAGRGRGMTRR
ncbi:uncharacterized protein LOC111336287 [Stylophora pistillata]|uniref:Gametocyte-specific factor 1 n=1 Tax=Stylophora pistillata TaxID=50429 RepID=A0A2B4RR46_STYPI|nr:uncharacterized protein LOC111336287 [Stylophora pistillata]PFX20914.1 Gametocyte-specific factor 1 [Stylophora pistillata]